MTSLTRRSQSAHLLGSMSHTIRGAAIDAIPTGTEAITKKSLAAIPLDHSAQSFSHLSSGTRQ
ncbi:hypothetical protein [Streptomyces sp. NPDC057580]|uniref:hypothetical protein n=1 Tax=Streptomyces sp. NPDC057580 TaxID=3346173 RepID=UPI0036AF7C60